MVPRRSFLTALASLSGVALARPAFAMPVSDTWDLSWLDQLKGRHKQVFAVGSLPDQLPLHIVVNYLDAHREVFGLAYPDIVEAAVNQKVRALWVIATNPVVSFPNLAALQHSLNALEFFVVQDGFHPTPTTELADLVLPAAVWGEKEGTYTNSARRVS